MNIPNACTEKEKVVLFYDNENIVWFWGKVSANLLYYIILYYIILYYIILYYIILYYIILY